ncbi:acetolactate synthase, regulatory subunit [Saitoella coloradoensis]
MNSRSALLCGQAMRASAQRTTTPIVQQARHNSRDATSAIAYKALHRRSRPPPLPKIDPPAWSPSEAVTNIVHLYGQVPIDATRPQRHILNCLVQNEPGVLSRVSGILAARGFNIDSLVVCNTEVADLSRMTIVLRGKDAVVEQARRQLEDLVPVWAVLDYTRAAIVERELLLAKVSILGPEHFHELLAHHQEMYEEALSAGEFEATEDGSEGGKYTEYHPASLAPSQALRQKHEHLQAITTLANQFGGKVVDISNDSCIVELCAKPTRLDAFMKLMSPFGILESARSGMMALPRTSMVNPDEANKDKAEQVNDVVDASMLPPG